MNQIPQGRVKEDRYRFKQQKTCGPFRAPPNPGRPGGAAAAKEMGHRGTRAQLGQQVAGVESAAGAGAGAPARRSLGDPFCGRAVKGGWKEVIYANRPNEAGKKKPTIIWKGSDLFPPSSMSAVTPDAPQGRTRRRSRCCSVNAMLPVVTSATTLRYI